mmetsp:Transcript_36953/g.106640  ORF Transcript_36953/g.106640 Transcript_36953/m.106640 type:complete len:469 (+) Transcript_36953:68-1474(+)
MPYLVRTGTGPRNAGPGPPLAASAPATLAATPAVGTAAWRQEPQPRSSNSATCSLPAHVASVRGAPPVRPQLPKGALPVHVHGRSTQPHLSPGLEIATRALNREASGLLRREVVGSPGRDPGADTVSRDTFESALREQDSAVVRDIGRRLLAQRGQLENAHEGLLAERRALVEEGTRLREAIAATIRGLAEAQAASAAAGGGVFAAALPQITAHLSAVVAYLLDPCAGRGHVSPNSSEECYEEAVWRLSPMARNDGNPELLAKPRHGITGAVENATKLGWTMARQLSDAWASFSGNGRGGESPDDEYFAVGGSCSTGSGSGRRAEASLSMPRASELAPLAKARQSRLERSPAPQLSSRAGDSALDMEASASAGGKSVAPSETETALLVEACLLMGGVDVGTCRLFAGESCLAAAGRCVAEHALDPRLYSRLAAYMGRLEAESDEFPVFATVELPDLLAAVASQTRHRG